MVTNFVLAASITLPPTHRGKIPLPPVPANCQQQYVLLEKPSDSRKGTFQSEFVIDSKYFSTETNYAFITFLVMENCSVAN